MELLAAVGSAGVSELAEKTGYTRSNVHRLLQTLSRTGWVRQRADHGSYELSFKLWEIAQNWILRFDLPRLAAPHLAQLGIATQETVHLAVLEHHDAVFVATFETPRPVRIHAPLGSRAPAHCTAMGKAILAFLPPAKLEFLNHQLSAVTPRSLTGERLLADLERTRRRGYAINLAEWQEGVNGVAVPIFVGSSESVIASVGIFGPAERLNQQAMRRHLPLIQETAQRIAASASQTALC